MEEPAGGVDDDKTVLYPTPPVVATMVPTRPLVAVCSVLYAVYVVLPFFLPERPPPLVELAYIAAAWLGFASACFRIDATGATSRLVPFPKSAPKLDEITCPGSLRLRLGGGSKWVDVPAGMSLKSVLHWNRLLYDGV